MGTPVSLLGTFSSSSFWTVRAVAGGATLYSVTCSGQVAVKSQSGMNWTGTFLSTKPCGDASDAVHGTVDAGGNVTLRFDAVSQGKVPYTAEGCTADTGGSEPQMTGTLSGNQIDLKATVKVTCQGSPTVTANVDVIAKGSR